MFKLRALFIHRVHTLTRSHAMQRSRAVHVCVALRLVGGCTRRYNNVGGVNAGQAPHNSSNVGAVTAATWDTTIASTASTSPCVARVKYQ